MPSRKKAHMIVIPVHSSYLTVYGENHKIGITIKNIMLYYLLK